MDSWSSTRSNKAVHLCKKECSLSACRLITNCSVHFYSVRVSETWHECWLQKNHVDPNPGHFNNRAACVCAAVQRITKIRSPHLGGRWVLANLVRTWKPKFQRGDLEEDAKSNMGFTSNFEKLFPKWKSESHPSGP